MVLLVSCLFCFSELIIADTNETFQAQVVVPSRAFGYTLGDQLEQTILLARGDKVLSLAELPIEQREGRWLTRTHASLIANGRMLSIRYQLINAPLNVRVIELPELVLQTNENIDITVPAWPFSIAPLIPGSAEEQMKVPAMQPDWQPPELSVDTFMRNLKVLAAALAIALLSWLLWWLWRNWREAHTLPFAQAYQSLRHAKSGEPLHKNADSWLCLHNAFNRSAGRSVDSGSIAALLSNVPWLKPHEAEIKTFFELSSARFFSPENSVQNIDLGKLSKRLYKAEKKHTGEQKRRDKNVSSSSPDHKMHASNGVQPP